MADRPAPQLDLATLQFHGRALVRPECVLATADGSLYTADWRGGVAQTHADGRQTLYTGRLPEGRPLRPNGIALRQDGSFLLADLGETAGGVFALTRAGALTPFLERVDGVDLPPTNFVAEDTAGRVWVTVSTRRQPRAAAYRNDVADGFIVVVDARGARIVADGLGYTNEALVAPDGHWLYVNETFGRRTSRYRIDPGAELSGRETVATYGAGTFPDGLCFDAEGGVWITSIVSNRVIRVAPGGAQTLVLEDADPAHLAWVEQAFLSGTMGRAHLDRAAGRVLGNISSLAFGGPGLRTAYLGCLLGDAIASFAVARRRTSARRTGTGAAAMKPVSRMTATTPTTDSLVDLAYQKLRQRILDNEWPPGARALEQELALELGMSRTPVREALIRLSNEGLVEVVPRHGVRVLPVSAADMDEIYRVIGSLEATAAEIIAERKPKAGELKPLEDATRAMDAALKADDLQAWAAGRRALPPHAGRAGRQPAARDHRLQLLGSRPPRPDVHAAAARQADALDPRAPGAGARA